MWPGIIFFGLLTIIFTKIFQWLIEYFTFRKKLEGIPSSVNPLFFGLSRTIIKIPPEDRMKWVNDLCFQHSEGIVVLWTGPNPKIVIRKPKQMEVIFPSTTLLTKSNIYDSIKPWLGNGLITSTGSIWFHHRRLITPAFHFGVLEEYAEVMREKVEILIERLKTQYDANPKAPINIFEFVVKYTLDTICETAMGVNMECQRKSDNEYIVALRRFGKLTSERFIRPWYNLDFIYYRTKSGKELMKAIKIMHNFTEKLVKDKKKIREEKIRKGEMENDEFDEFGKRKRKAFLDLLLDASESTKNPLTFQEIREEVETFMFAGHDTTTSAISWALFALGNEPEVQAKVHRELKEVFGNGNETATMKELGQLKYLDRVVKEALRMYPSAPSISRRLDCDTVIDGYHLPKGVNVNMHIYQLHHDPEVWEDPERFDPDRFLPENSAGRHSYAYAPFSAGPRNCIGQKFAILEIKTALTAILRKWRVTSALKRSEVKMIINIILKPHNEKIDLYFTPVDNQ